jgi:hypothetical protein
MPCGRVVCHARVSSVFPSHGASQSLMLHRPVAAPKSRGQRRSVHASGELAASPVAPNASHVWRTIPTITVPRKPRRRIFDLPLFPEGVGRTAKCEPGSTYKGSSRVAAQLRIDQSTTACNTPAVSKWLSTKA